uniref:FLYWCH-type domain-containing protein n=1 Tax=Meloidogyne javanica TaxID=6303 RepID=A0A915LTY8_MELJA
MNKDKKTTTAVVGQQQPVPANVVSQAPPISVAAAPKLAAAIEEMPKINQQNELMPIIRPPAGSFSGCSMDAGDEDTDEHLQVTGEIVYSKDEKVNRRYLFEGFSYHKTSDGFFRCIENKTNGCGGSYKIVGKRPCNYNYHKCVVNNGIINQINELIQAGNWEKALNTAKQQK